MSEPSKDRSPPVHASSIDERLPMSETGGCRTRRALVNGYVRLLKSLHLPAGPRVASLSCGFGDWDYITLQTLPGIREVVATDIVNCPVTPEDVTRLNAIRPWSYVRVVPEAPLPFTTGSFDLVFHHDVIEHVAKSALFVAESSRIVKAGGHLVFSTPNLLRPGNLLRLLAGRLSFPTGGEGCGEGQLYGGTLYFHGHVQEFASWTLVALLEEAGFADVQVVPCYFGFSPLGLHLAEEPRSRLGKGLAHILLVHARKPSAL
jgi:SAM-dependent methyltransferase